MGAQSAFERAREISIADILEGIELHMAGAHEVKAFRRGAGFVHGTAGMATKVRRN